MWCGVDVNVNVNVFIFIFMADFRAKQDASRTRTPFSSGEKAASAAGPSGASVDSGPAAGSGARSSPPLPTEQQREAMKLEVEEFRVYYEYLNFNSF